MLNSSISNSSNITISLNPSSESFFGGNGGYFDLPPFHGELGGAKSFLFNQPLWNIIPNIKIDLSFLQNISLIEKVTSLKSWTFSEISSLLSKTESKQKGFDNLYDAIRPQRMMIWAFPMLSSDALEALEAARVGNLEAIRQLKERGFDFNTLNSEGVKVLHSMAYIAASEGKLEVLKFLVKNCGLILKECTSPTTLKEAALINNHISILSYLQESELRDISRYLGANITIKTSRPFMPFSQQIILTTFQQIPPHIPAEAQGAFTAAKQGDLETIRQLKEEGFDFNILNNKGVKVLHLMAYAAALEGKLEVLQFLVSDCELALQDCNSPVTLVEAASRNCHLPILNYLQEAGVSFEGVDIPLAAVQGAAGEEETCRVLKWCLEKGVKISSMAVSLASQLGKNSVKNFLTTQGIVFDPQTFEETLDQKDRRKTLNFLKGTQFGAGLVYQARNAPNALRALGLVRHINPNIARGLGLFGAITRFVTGMFEVFLEIRWYGGRP